MEDTQTKFLARGRPGLKLAVLPTWRIQG